jgi:hypothetical protein
VLGFLLFEYMRGHLDGIELRLRVLHSRMHHAVRNLRRDRMLWVLIHLTLVVTMVALMLRLMLLLLFLLMVLLLLLLLLLWGYV